MGTIRGRKSPKQVKQMDEQNARLHPVVKSDKCGEFSFAGLVAMNSYLLRNSSEPEGRTEWELKCPQCKSFLGFWISAPAGVPLSVKQQRKNRNMALFGKSHYQKMHSGSQPTKSKSVENEVEASDEASERSTSTKSGGHQTQQRKRKSDSELDQTVGSKFARHAKEGDVEAQLGLGQDLLYYGHDVLVRARHWLTHAAEAGSTVAQYHLGNMDADGSGGLHRDDKIASEWFHMSAARGFQTAQLKLAEIYQEGLGVEKSLEKALTLCYKAVADRVEGDNTAVLPESMNRAREFLKVLIEEKEAARETASSESSDEESTRSVASSDS